MFNCFKKEQKEEPKKGLEISESSTPFHLQIDGTYVRYIIKGEDGLYRACFSGSTEWGTADILKIAGKLQDLNIRRDHE